MKQTSSIPFSATIANARLQTAQAMQGKSPLHAKARAAAEDFEAVFLNSMFSQMFTETGGEGPFGGGKEMGVWRSFLTDEYSKSFAKKGGIGIADHVYASLLAHQEARGAARDVR
jgi:peptidoglycan hydrolase FlgJ